MANQILTRMSMAYRTARISDIRECFRYMWHGNAGSSVAALQNTRQMAQLIPVHAAAMESEEIDFGGLIDIQIQLSTATRVTTISLMKVRRGIAGIAALMPWPLYPRGERAPCTH
jgi:hypothetical protein